MKRLFATIAATIVGAPLLTALGWGAYGAHLAASQPKLRLETVTPLAISSEKTLPFFELMTPLPTLEGHRFVPKLEYKKGPPRRYLERLTLLLSDEAGKDRERVVYHGRRTRTDLTGLELLPAGEAREATYVNAAVHLAAGEPSGLDPAREFLLRPFLLKEAAAWTAGADSVQILEQAGTPAFLFRGLPAADGSLRSTALFVRRNSFYRVDYLADRAFFALDPEAYFRKSFLVEKRGEALDYLARNLSEVKVDGSQAQSAGNVTWPILLLAANLSVDPASVDAYFHFAGISALLYRTLAGVAADAETLDTLRNNVLAADFYARDVAPESRQAAEIGRLARLLTRNFE